MTRQSELRLKFREESKHVSKLTMENMNLASRCREAIAQLAVYKKELNSQKRKTAQAVQQTNYVLLQLKKLKQQQQQQQQDDSEHKQDDAPTTTHISLPTSSYPGIAPAPALVSSDDYDESEHTCETPTAPELPPPPRDEPVTSPLSTAAVSPATPHRFDAPAPLESKSSEDSETQDTVSEIGGSSSASPRRGFFPKSASPKIGRRTYNENYPSEPTTTRTEGNLLSSIDAFEASFSTNFPESFSPKPSSPGSFPFDQAEQEPSGLLRHSPRDPSPSTKSLRHALVNELRRRSPQTIPSRTVANQTANFEEISKRNTSPPDPSYSPRSTSPRIPISVDTKHLKALPLSPSSAITPAAAASPPLPQRPKKAGYDVARAKYDRALKKRSGISDRISKFEDLGDIPMQSKLSPYRKENVALNR